MSGSHYANAPDPHGAYFSAAPEPTRYDLRTVDKIERADVTALRLELDREREAREYLERRVAALERTAARHADLWQVHLARHEDEGR